MTASKKIFFAAVIVAAGYGLATLWGAPARLPSLALDRAGDDIPATATTTNPPEAAPSPAPGHWALEGVRLIPDPDTIQPEQGAADEALFASDAIESNDSTLTLVTVAPPPSADAITPLSSPRTAACALPGPQARLRNEAPRALAVEPSPPLVVKSLEPVMPASAPPVEPVQPIQLPAAPIATSYEAVAAAPALDAITPRPHPAPEEPQEPRRHIIVDGDSLTRLAGRYLDDPHRGDEIFELNRHLLSDPHLLPIGVELVIPPRGSGARDGTASPRSCLPSGLSVHTATRGGLIPVQPIPSSVHVTPRAQLSPPRPIE